jgi:uncharacterized membrane protein
MKLRIARAVVLTAYFFLLLLVLAWHAWLFPAPHVPVSLMLLITAVPLLVPLRGVLHGRARSHLWAAFLSLVYFVHGVGEAMANPAERWLGLAEVASSLLLFFAATLYARWASEPLIRELGGES